MQIHIRGFRDREMTSLIKDAVEFYAGKLMHKNLTRYLQIDIVRKKLHGRIDGYCEVIDPEYRPRIFQIEVNSNIRKKRDIFETIAHEMVHVKQYATRELVQPARGNFQRWQGYDYTDGTMDYWDEPWEIEAYGRSIGLFSRFVDQYQLRDYFRMKNYDNTDSRI